jgi:ferulate-5-hydroxylase
MRKLCVMMLFSRQRNLSWRTVSAETGALVNSLAEKSGTVANVGELMFKFSSDTTFRAAFGGARGQDDEKAFVAIIKKLSEIFLAFNVADFIPWVGWLDLNGVNKRMKAVRRALDVFFDHVTRWRNGDVSSADMVDGMIAYLAETPPGIRDTREDGVELRDLQLTRDNVKGLIMV